MDLDNTLLNTTSACIACFDELTGITLTSADGDHYRYYEFYGWDEEMYEYVYRRHGHKIHWSSLPYPNAVAVVNQLSKKYRLTIMTARPDVFSRVTYDWLRHHRIEFNDLVFERDKFATCQTLNVDVLIDDAPHYAQEFSEKGKHFVIMDQPYNRQVEHSLIRRASGWQQVTPLLSSFASA